MDHDPMYLMELDGNNTPEELHYVSYTIEIML